jgi:uncharacterized protein (TIGR02246 family)
MSAGEARMARADDVKAAIQQVNQAFMEAFTRRDAGGVAALYAPEAQLLPPQADFVKDEAAIRAFWQGAMDMGIRDAKLETVDIEVAGDTAIELGRYTLTLDPGDVADQGKYLVIWKQHDGQWRLYRDVWNTSGSPQQIEGAPKPE